MRDPLLLRSWIKSKIAHAAYYLSWDGYAPASLYTISIMINSVCNLKCQHCDIGQGRDDLEYHKNASGKKELPLALFKDLIKDIKGHSPHVDRIRVNGVEPLLHKDFVPMMKIISQNKLSYYIATNGYLLADLAEDIVGLAPYYINVSVDGPPDVHDKIRGVPGSFEKAYEGIARVIQIKKKLRKSFPKVYINYTISSLNAHCLSDTVAIFQGLGVDGFKFIHLNYITREMAEDFNTKFSGSYEASPSSINKMSLREVDEGALFEQIGKVKKLTPFYFFSLDLKTPEAIRQYYRNPEVFFVRKMCYNPWLHAQILANGDVVPEARCFHPYLGNIYEEKFSSIWNNARFRTLRKKLRSGGATPACSRCFGLFR
ncbi:MAG: radical SAM protein [Candidatus Omnitrophica bacterium]|nr:radical SAM protein [Candidatus Omnitrophota bacterium]MDD5236483.1 radical SAM protein [Candidatus Omnitrophota bacterium]